MLLNQNLTLFFWSLEAFELNTALPVGCSDELSSECSSCTPASAVHLLPSVKWISFVFRVLLGVRLAGKAHQAKTGLSVEAKK